MEKINPNAPASPQWDMTFQKNPDLYSAGTSTGLTIRQELSAMFLQGLLSNSKSAELLALGYSDGTERERTINMATIASRAAVQYADFLIAELNKPINLTDPETQSNIEREANNEKI